MSEALLFYFLLCFQQDENAAITHRVRSASQTPAFSSECKVRIGAQPIRS